MSKKKLPIFIILIVVFLMAVGFTSNNSWQSLIKIVDKTLRGVSGGIVISENHSDGREITGGYVIQENKTVPVTTEKYTVTINKGSEQEYNFNLIKFISNDQVLSIRPEKEGSPLDFIVGKKMIVFRTGYDKGLWIMDKNSLQPNNIQPESVNGISQSELDIKRSELAKEGKDPESYILYWAVNPLLSPNEDCIAFASNREGFPLNTKTGLWITDLKGNTELIVQENDDITPITWASGSEVIYIGDSGLLKKINVDTKAVETLINNKVSVNTSSPNGKKIIYQNVEKGQVLPDVFVISTDTGKNLKLSIPSGFSCQGFYGWDETSSKVAFYIQDMNLNLKLVILDLNNSKNVILDAPQNTKFDDYVVPSWSNGKVIISASGKTFAVY